jgi:hypothetical protein
MNLVIQNTVPSEESYNMQCDINTIFRNLQFMLANAVMVKCICLIAQY